MSVIEIACFLINSQDISHHSKAFLAGAPFDKPTATLRFYLSHGIRTLSKASKHEFYLLQDYDDPLYFYYIGKWADLQAYGNWFGTEERGELVKDLNNASASMVWKGLYEIENYENWEKSVLSGLLHRRKDALEAHFVGITRGNVAPEDAPAFERQMGESRPSLEKFSKYKSAAGRRSHAAFEEDMQTLDEAQMEDAKRQEFMILGGWESKKKYDEFPDSEEYRTYMQIREQTKWFERKLAQPIHLE